MDVLREILLPKLEAVKFSGGSWMARCPAHEDGTASLHISRGTTHPVVLNCHAGCDPVDILAKVGLTWKTLCAPREDEALRGEWTPNGPAIAVYDYTDETGKLLFQVLRTAGKKFPQRIPDQSRKTGWQWNLDGTRRVLYRLPKVIEAVRDGEIIYVCEGEKDVHAIERRGRGRDLQPRRRREMAARVRRVPPRCRRDDRRGPGPARPGPRPAGVRQPRRHRPRRRDRGGSRGGP